MGFSMSFLLSLLGVNAERINISGPVLYIRTHTLSLPIQPALVVAVTVYCMESFNPLKVAIGLGMLALLKKEAGVHKYCTVVPVLSPS
jgi:hypothetical protein